MGISHAAQLRAFGEALLLGATLALLYELLRALRLRSRRARALTGALDALYCLLLAAAALLFALRVGDGELRLYMLLAAVGGAALFAAVCAPPLRPLWDFWAETLVLLCRALRLPLRKLKIFYGKLTKVCKRVFLFWKTSLIIGSYRRYALRSRRRILRREAVRHGGKPGKAETARRFSRGAGDLRAAGGRRLSADEPARQDRRRRGGAQRPGRAGRAAGAGKPLP